MAFDSSTREIGLSANTVKKAAQRFKMVIFGLAPGEVYTFMTLKPIHSQNTYMMTQTLTRSAITISPRCLQDKGGVLWVGTLTVSASSTQKSVAFPKFRSSANPGLTSDATTSFSSGKNDDSVWLGTLGQVFTNGIAPQTVSHFSTEDSGLSDNRVMS